MKIRYFRDFGSVPTPLWFSHLPWSPLRTFHLAGHHTLYPDSRHTRSTQFHYGSGRASSIPALLPWLVIEATLAWVLVAGWRLAVAISEIVVLVVLFNAVHTQFHLLAPGLERRRGFARPAAGTSSTTTLT